MRERLKQIATYLDWVVAIVLAVVVSVLGVLDKIPATILAATTLLVLGIFALSALRDRYGSQRLTDIVTQLNPSNIAALYSGGLLSDRLRTGIERVIPKTVDFDWLPEIQTATSVTIAKLKLNFTQNPSYYRAFETVLRKHGSVTIVMADPRSPAMWLRYKEEPSAAFVAASENERKKRESFETIWVNGLEELAADLHRLDAWRKRLIQEGRDVRRLSIKVSPHYPTHAFYKFDSRLYVYHYPYLERGFQAPTFLFTNPNTDTHKFLCGCIDSIVNSSLPLEDEIDDIWHKCGDGLFSDERVLSSELVVARQKTQKDETTKRRKNKRP